MKHYYVITDVYIFEKRVSKNWQRSTWAKSESQALNNLKARFKKEYGLTVNAKVDFKNTKIDFFEEDV